MEATCRGAYPYLQALDDYLDLTEFTSRMGA